MNGWIKLHRSLLESPSWADRPLPERVALVELLLRANYRQTKRYDGKKVHAVEPGELVVSIRKLSAETGIPRSTMRLTLQNLVNTGFIEVVDVSTGRGGHSKLVRVLNWEQYQGDDEEGGQDKAPNPHSPVTAHVPPTSRPPSNSATDNDNSDSGAVENEPKTVENSEVMPTDACNSAETKANAGPKKEELRIKKEEEDRVSGSAAETRAKVDEMAQTWNGLMPKGLVAQARLSHAARKQTEAIGRRIGKHPWIYERFEHIVHGALVKYADMIQERRATFLVFGWVATAPLATLETVANLGEDSLAGNDLPAEEVNVMTASCFDGEELGRALVIWQKIEPDLKTYIATEEWDKWFGQFKPAGVLVNEEDGTETLYLQAVSVTVRDWVRENYDKYIKMCLEKIGYKEMEVGWAE